jgi:acetyl esterase
MVSSRNGLIRVLEYGFDSLEIQPLMIDLHGGGFIFNTADVDEAIILQMRQLVPACKFISIDYPKAPEHPFPAAPDSVYDVILYYTTHAQEFGIDTDHMVIGGHSAGANLATVTCLRAGERKEFSFLGQILDYPPLDLKTPAQKKPTPEGCIPPDLAELFNACYVGSYQPDNPEISPIFADVPSLRGMPPALFIVCGHDSLHDEGVHYAHMLEKADVDVSLYDYPKELHGFTYDDTPAAHQAVAKMADFLIQCLKKD